MKKIRDERLILKNLKYMQIALIIQTIGITSILVYNAITIDLSSAIKSPFMFVLILSCIPLIYGNIDIGIDNNKRPDRQSNLGPLLVVLGIGIAAILLFIFTSDPMIKSTAIVVVIFSICFTVIYPLIRYLEKIRDNRL
ncbi:hypothetical protein KFZ56_18215 [Virgibacillus sp. NKC19-3]|uniref:hypothetical protein n=1 Tax=Virgibacillus saliphilus TaxID=2831674 RepID=UPI001C9A6FCE|nr:hypothetical protein [Virgibacillus sp. NKC19-3]MBY7144955.1 hypothetical protein [Virgibacillus sp. NKC19-3]